MIFSDLPRFPLGFRCLAENCMQFFLFFLQKASNFEEILHINGERKILGRQKVVRGSSVPILTSHVGLNPRSKSGYEREARVIKYVDKGMKGGI